MPWIQIYNPVAGNIGLSALVAAIPLAVIFGCLAVLKMKAHKAGILAVGSAIAIAIVVWGMPAKLAALSTLQGSAFGLFPIFWIVLTTIFLYNITVKGGQFEILRASLAGLTNDRRLQSLLIAFCFGAFIEGAAGFGTPVAIAGATLVGLGFRPFYAAAVCLIANTAPVAFGSIGTPIVALAGVMGYDNAGLMKLSTMVGRQLPFISLVIPFYIIFIMVGWKKTIEVLPAIIVTGVSFAITQWGVSSYLGPYLTDILASLAALVCLVGLLQVWQPKEVWKFDHEPESDGKEQHHYTGLEVLRAWGPYLALTVMVLIWGIPSVKQTLDKATIKITVPGLNNAIIKKVAKPEDGIKKIATVTAEIDKQLPLLAPADPAQAKVVAGLTEIRGLEEKLQTVEQGLVGKGTILTDDRLKAYDAVSAKVKELQKSSKELVAAKIIQKNQFKALDKAFTDQLPARVEAKFTFNYLSAAGTASLIACLISALICGVGFGDLLQVAGKTLKDMRFPAVTVACFVGLAYIMNTSGMTTSLGLAFTMTGHFFPFVSAVLGMLGVFLTGSDTSSNVLFGGLQKVTAEQLGISPILCGAANSSGGVMGKMISPQSITVACAATNIVGEEGNLLRFTLKHSLILTTVVGVMVYMQAYYFPWMIP